MNTNKILLSTNTVLKTITQILDLLRASSPTLAAASGPIGLATSALAIVTELTGELVKSGVMTIAEQEQLQAEIQAILDGRKFEGAQWKPRPESPDYVPPTAS